MELKLQMERLLTPAQVGYLWDELLSRRAVLTQLIEEGPDHADLIFRLPDWFIQTLPNGDSLRMQRAAQADRIAEMTKLYGGLTTRITPVQVKLQEEGHE